jgi:pyruvate/2-oxoglutarate dehydrogenase complex dihydrolipoamide acyltransferase (E2) component
VIDVVLPKMGMQTVEVDVTEVFVAVGDVVTTGAPLFGVESEKVEMVIEAEGAGTVTEVHASVGDVITPGFVLARLDPTD